MGITTKLGINSNAERRNALRFISVKDSADIDLYMLSNQALSDQLCSKHKQVLHKMLEDMQD